VPTRGPDAYYGGYGYGYGYTQQETAAREARRAQPAARAKQPRGRRGRSTGTSETAAPPTLDELGFRTRSSDDSRRSDPSES